MIPGSAVRGQDKPVTSGGHARAGGKVLGLDSDAMSSWP